MLVSLSHGGLVLKDPDSSPKTLPLLAPVNDLMGLRDDNEYAIHLHSDYLSFWPADWPEELPDDLTTFSADGEPLSPSSHYAVALMERVHDELRLWKRQAQPRLFRQAAHLAQEGRLAAKLGPYLERILRRPNGQPDEVPDGDLPVLATWALDEALRLKPLVVRDCPLCGVPWIAETGQPSPYCARPYPGRQMSCREVKKDEHFHESHRGWRLEYKRIHERKHRGTVTNADWGAWRADNGPHGWIPFDEWKRRPDTIASIPTV